MAIYYKYTRYTEINNLIDFHLRLSTPITLNDPFESLLNETVENKLRSSIQLRDLGFPNLSNHFSHHILETMKHNAIKNLVNEYGIVSLSETPRNLLMWAHYACEHEGICVGFDENLFEDVSHITTKYKIEHYTPLKINYDSMRPQQEDISDDPIEELKNQARNQLLTKSDEWIYEKEHRCILPLDVADKMIWLKPEPDTMAQAAIDDLKKERIIDEIAKNTYAGVGLMTLSNFMNDLKSAVFLKKIDLKSIKTIHLGCKMSEVNKKEIIAKVTLPNSPLYHVQIIDCTPSKSRFELEMVRKH